VYWALVVSAVFFGIVVVLATKDLFGTATLPITYQALEMTAAAVRLFGLIMVTFYAGELMWRERDVGAQDIFDATRAPTWVGYTAKLGALLLVALSVEGVSAAVALVSQVARGYFAIEWRLYPTELLLIDFTGLALASVLACFVHVVVDHKYIGHAVMVLYYVSRIALAAIGVEEPLVRYASEPSTEYSDMNGYGHLLEAFFWFRAYWLGLAVVLLVAGYALFGRGRERRLRARLAAGRRRLGALAKAVAAAGALVFLASGVYIFHSTHVLNRYETAKDMERQRAEYEKKYKSVDSLPQPSIVGAEVRMDIYPEERRLVAKGTYRLANKGGEPISRVMVNLDDELLVHELRIGDTRATEVDDRLAVRFFTLSSPLAPGEEGGPRLRPRAASEGVRARLSEDAGGPQRDLREQRRPPGDRLLADPRARERPRPQELRARAEGAHGAARRPERANAQLHPPGLGLHPVRGHREHVARSDRGRARVPRGRVVGRQPARVPLRHGSDDPELLLGAVGAICRPARRVERREARDLPPPRAHAESRSHDAGDEGDARVRD
jgi:hypothetical protein